MSLLYLGVNFLLLFGNGNEIFMEIIFLLLRELYQLADHRNVSIFPITFLTAVVTYRAVKVSLYLPALPEGTVNIPLESSKALSVSTVQV